MWEYRISFWNLTGRLPRQQNKKKGKEKPNKKIRVNAHSSYRT